MIRYKRGRDKKEGDKMNIEIVKNEDNYVELKFIDEDPSIFYALRDVLAEDSDVEFVSALQEHPQIENVILMVRTKKGKPIDRIMKGLGKLDKVIDSLESSLF